MDLLSTILAKHSKEQTDLIVKYIGKDPKRFADLMNLFLKGEYRVTQRAAWPMRICGINHPELVKPWYGKLMQKMKEPGVHNSVLRNTLRLLQYVPLPEKYHGEIMTACFDWMADITAPAAVKAFSITLLHQLSGKYPEIGDELAFIIKDRWDEETAAFRSRGRKVLAALKKQ
ncbi:hypothetical protein HHL16_22990 [Pseudoflavitalea sp. G-6-1-2]|uniref:hypothetical protein n=1 Tax=Pseudoflavitalea sp. G-6-1-2 TaxID=2728841 RepID=UPI00146D8835|nr:hypothetical protein [Pseudoflavitalea sp. G-6-1-2]NML23766.1 hypothetical protein [Pseudoflavitalea sp. G-6-1-2]